MNRFGNYCYTYLVGQKQLDTYYYGYRSGNFVPPEEDLQKEYFTSSQYVSKFVEENGQPDVIHVHKLFTSTEDARLYEKRFIDKVHAVKSDRQLNKHNSGEKFFATPEAIEKRAATSKAFYQTEEGKEFLKEKAKKISAGKLASGYSHSEETRKKIRDHHAEYYQTEEGKETLRKMSEKLKGREAQNKGVPNPEGIRKMNEARLSKPSAALGIPKSEETRRKISESVKKNRYKETPEQIRIKSEATKLWQAAGRPPGGVKPFYELVKN